MQRRTVVLDANVIYGACMRDILLRLADQGLFNPLWSAHIHTEWVDNLLLKRPDLTRDKLERIRKTMDQHFPSAIVTGYEPLIARLDLPDPQDRHVVAAALRGGANVIMTQNLRDFPAERLAPYKLEAQHPDKFISELFESQYDEVLTAVHDHRAALRNPPRSPDEYLKALEEVGLIDTAVALRNFKEFI